MEKGDQRQDLWVMGISLNAVVVVKARAAASCASGDAGQLFWTRHFALTCSPHLATNPPALCLVSSPFTLHSPLTHNGRPGRIGCI